MSQRILEIIAFFAALIPISIVGFLSVNVKAEAKSIVKAGLVLPSLFFVSVIIGLLIPDSPGLSATELISGIIVVALGIGTMVSNSVYFLKMGKLSKKEGKK